MRRIGIVVFMLLFAVPTVAQIATLKERPNFDPNKFMDDRFLKKALVSLGVKEQ